MDVTVSVSKVLSCVHVPRGGGCYDQKCSVNLFCLIRERSICAYCPASKTLFGTRGCGGERQLWLEKYVCEWGNGSIAKGQGE